MRMRQLEMNRMRVQIYGLVILLGGIVFSVHGQPASKQGPPTDTVAPDIAGVVKGGTKVQFIKDGFQGTEGPIGMPDGSLIFTETNANRITKIDKDGNTS